MPVHVDRLVKAQRLARLKQFWEMVQGTHGSFAFGVPGGLGVGGVFKGWSTAAIPAATALANLNTFTRGVSGFFKPNPWAAWGMHAALGVDQAGFYSTAPLRKTLGELVDFDAINAKRMRLTLGAVNVSSGDMRYFDSRDETLGPEHVMASGALPPAFPAVRIGGASYWDGGIYSNTPIEAVLDDKPRRDSLIFSANMWQPTDAEPETLANVLARQFDEMDDAYIRERKADLEQVVERILRNMDREVAASGLQTPGHGPRDFGGDEPLILVANDIAPADMASFADALSRLSGLAIALKDVLSEIDVNPFLVGPKGSVALDALVVPKKK